VCCVLVVVVSIRQVGHVPQDALQYPFCMHV
jgi:hypothetical protein